MDKVTLRASVISGILFLVVIILIFELSPGFSQRIKANPTEKEVSGDKNAKSAVKTMEMDPNDNLDIPIPEGVTESDITVSSNMIYKSVNISFDVKDNTFDVAGVKNTAKQIIQISYSSDNGRIDISISLGGHYNVKWLYQDNHLYVRFFDINNSAVKVLVDPGHGGNDVGANRDGIFDTIISNLENMNLHKKRPMIDIKTIVLENNLDDLPKLYKMCNDMKFNFFSISFLRNNNLKQNSLLFDNFVPEFTANYPIEKYFDLEHFKEIYKELETMSKDSMVKIRFSPKFEYCKDPLEAITKFFNTPADKPISDIYEPCKYPFSNMMITPAGDVYPCLSQKIGNVKDLSIKEVFNLPHYRCFRKNLKASKVFGACQMCCELCPKE